MPTYYKVNKELKQRIIFTIFILLIYRFGTFVPIPGINTEVLKSIFNNLAFLLFIPRLTFLNFDLKILPL